jgi:hypothetical protein
MFLTGNKMVRGFQGFAVLMMVVVMGCAPRGAMVFAPSPVGAHHEILVGTTRLPIAGNPDFGRGRSLDLAFASYTVAVPPAHKLGQVEWPDATPDLALDFVMTDHRHFPTAQGFSRVVAAKGEGFACGPARGSDFRAWLQHQSGRRIVPLHPDAA